MSSIEEAWGFFKEFTGVFQRSANNCRHTETFTKDLHELLSHFAGSLQHLIEKYSDGFFETDQGRLLGGSLSKMAASYKSLSVQLKTEVMEPFRMFMENFKVTIEATAKKASDTLGELERQRTALAKHQNVYYQSSIKLLKSKQDIERAIEKIEKGGKNSDLLKANEVGMKLRIVVDQNQREYRDQLEKTNGQWKRALKELATLRSMVDYNQESRLSFTRNTTNAMLRLILQEWPQPDKSQIEEVLTRRDGQKPVKQPSAVDVRLDKFIANDKKERFLSYDESTRRQQKREHDGINGEGDVTDEDVDQITLLLNMWLAVGDQPKTKESLDRVRLLIMSSRPHSCYFIESLYRRVQLMSSYYCKLDEDYFNEVQNTFLLIARCISSSDPETMWKLANVSMRLMKKKKDKNNSSLRELICSHLGGDRALQDEKLWQSVWQYIRERGDKKPTVQQQSTGWGSMLVQGLKGLNSLVRGKAPKQEDQLKTVQQVATLMASMCLPSEFIFPVVKRMLETIGEGKSLELLKDHLHGKQDIQIRQRLTNFKEKSTAHQQKDIDLIGSRRVPPYVLKLVAKRGFLNTSDIRLRLVCRKLKRVHRIILYQLEFPHKLQRLVDAPARDYIRMKTEVAEHACPSAIEEIITLDVNRSLHIHADYLPPTLLHTLLRTFAYYNKEIGYCQGMNYLAGYLYIKTRDEEEAYLVFERIMKERFWEVFANQFEALKLKLYQFDRLLNIFIPDLADHFKRQIVSPECYMVSWVIALFSSSYQYTKESYLVDLLWLRFMVWGWREFFKFVLWLLHRQKEELMELGFDRVLHLLGETLRSDLLKASPATMEPTLSRREFFQQLDQFHITDGLLDKLSKEYKMSVGP